MFLLSYFCYVFLLEIKASLIKFNGESVMLRPVVSDSKNTQYTPYVSFVENNLKPEVKKTSSSNSTVLKQNQEKEDFSQPLENYIGEVERIKK